jgi:hypothetical protein
MPARVITVKVSQGYENPLELFQNIVISRFRCYSCICVSVRMAEGIKMAYGRAKRALA